MLWKGDPALSLKEYGLDGRPGVPGRSWGMGGMSSRLDFLACTYPSSMYLCRLAKLREGGGAGQAGFGVRAPKFGTPLRKIL